TPPFHSDARAAWEGVYPRRPDIPLRVEAAAYRGKAVWFQLVAPWSRAERMEVSEPKPGQAAAQIMFPILCFVLFTAGAVLARQHAKAGRGDRRGAFRLASVIFVLGMVGFLLRSHHVADREGETRLLQHGAAELLLSASVLWLFYLALEPYVRRLWPHTIISWTRLMAGKVRGPLGGRGSPVGAGWGAGLAGFLTLPAPRPGRVGPT